MDSLNETSENDRLAIKEVDFVATKQDLFEVGHHIDTIQTDKITLDHDLTTKPTCHVIANTNVVKPIIADTCTKMDPLNWKYLSPSQSSGKQQLDISDARVVNETLTDVKDIPNEEDIPNEDTFFDSLDSTKAEVYYVLLIYVAWYPVGIIVF